MYPHRNTPNEPDHDQAAGVNVYGSLGVPSPRKAPDDDLENLPQIASDQGIWRYDLEQKSGRRRRFFGHISRAGGTEGERLRDEQATVIRDLLYWAAEQQSRDQSTKDGDTA